MTGPTRPLAVGDTVEIIGSVWAGERATVVETPTTMYADDPGPRVWVEFVRPETIRSAPLVDQVRRVESGPTQPADDLRARTVATLQEDPSQFVSHDDHGIYDVDWESVTDRAMEVVEPELARLREENAAYREREAKTFQALRLDPETWAVQLAALSVRQERDKLRDEVERPRAALARLVLTTTDSWSPDDADFNTQVGAAEATIVGLRDLRDSMGAESWALMRRERDETRAEVRSMVVDLHAAQFNGATSLPDRPLDTVWEWLLDLVRKGRALLSGGNTPADARTQIRDYLTGWLPARLSVPYDDTIAEVSMALAASLVDDVISEWRDDSSIRQPAMPADVEEQVDRVAKYLLGLQQAGGASSEEIDQFWTEGLKPFIRDLWRGRARVLLDLLAEAGWGSAVATPEPAAELQACSKLAPSCSKTCSKRS